VTDFNRDEAKEKKLYKKNLKGRLKKTVIFNSADSQYFSANISGIGPWVSRIT
jgi:hypothetical protein